MRPNRTFITLCLALTAPALWAPHAFSQHAVVAQQSRPNPADPAAQVPAATYRSAFSDFRPMGDGKVGDWRAANDEVGRIGGWREYAREAQAPEPARAAPAPKPAAPPQTIAPAAPASGGHGMHRHHGMPGAKQ